jgi:hypothetical protein
VPITHPPGHAVATSEAAHDDAVDCERAETMKEDEKEGIAQHIAAESPAENDYNDEGDGVCNQEDSNEEDDVEEEAEDESSEEEKKSTETEGTAQVERVDMPWDKDTRRTFAQLLVVQVRSEQPLSC